MKVYISGVHSGPNPSPGLGLARSLRVAYPELKLVAVDYSTRSSGLHSSEFDDVWIQRPWDELDLGLHGVQVRNILDSGALWLSELDLETRWLAETIGQHPGLLIPPSSSLAAVSKPDIPAHKALPMKIPPFISVSCPDWDLHAFCREYGWNVWLKGPYYEAHRIKSWSDFNTARCNLSSTWTADALFVQAHIPGHEESVAFSAYKGTLLECVYMSKRDITTEGKTWAGRITEVPSTILEPLRKTIAQLSWTGGAEVEFIKDNNNELWLIDWNPRFPAWIHGATIAGHNLVALLVQSVTDIPPVEITSTPSQDFTRVVIEIPCRQGLSLPPLPEPSTESDAIMSKHPSGMPMLAKRLRSSIQLQTAQGPRVPQQIMKAIDSLDLSDIKTPCRLQLSSVALARFADFMHLASELSNTQLKVDVAYSIKTDPNDWLLKTAFDYGMLAEAISQSEVEKAILNGFSPKQIVLNSPGKWWPLRSYNIADFNIIFSDSIEELSAYRGSIINRIGIRLRLPSVDSRFGIPVDTYEAFQTLVLILTGLSLERCPHDTMWA